MLSVVRNLFILFFSLIFMLSACTYDHAVSGTKKWAGRAYLAEYYEIQRNATERIPDNARLYVPFPATILGPKADVPQMEYLCDGLRSRFPQTYCALRPESAFESVSNAQKRGDDFLVSAEVVHWDDKQKPNLSESDSQTKDNYFYNNVGIDHVEIRMNIYYAQSNTLFDVVRLKARSPILSGFANQPVELLRCAYQDLAKVLSPEKNL